MAQSSRERKESLVSIGQMEQAGVGGVYSEV